MVKPPEAKRIPVLLPRGLVLERSIGWMRRFRQPATACQRSPETVAGLHFLALPAFCSPGPSSGSPPVHQTV